MTTASVGGSGISSSSSSTTTSRPLNNEAVFRIELSLSSRKSSVIVMRCTARLYSLEGVNQENPDNQGDDAEWKSIAYGAPCIQLMRETTEHNSPFHIKLVIAEVESGIGLWECQLDKGSKYNAMQNNFQTFSLRGKPHAIQFANEVEACRMLESVQDLLYQQEKLETVNFDARKGGGGDPASLRKTKSLKKLSKKDISAPCNFKHVSGITLQRTRTCEDELRGTIQRKLRSMSLSSLVAKRNKQRPQSEVIERNHYKDDDIQELEESPKVIKRGVVSDGKPPRSLRARLSMRSSKKKHEHTPLKITEVRDDLALPTFTRNSDNRRSLPSRGRKHVRPGLNGDTFDKPYIQDDDDFIFIPAKALSLSSGNLATSSMTQSHDQLSHHNSQQQQQSTGNGNSIERRHTMLGGKSYNYTPYSASVEKPNRPKYATLDRDSLQQYQQYQQQQQQQHPQANGRGNTPGGYGRQYTSDQSLHKNPAAKIRSHSTQQLNRGVVYRGEAGSGGQRSSYHEAQVPSSGGNYPQRSSYHEAQVPSTLHEVPPTNQVPDSYGNGNWNQQRLAAQSISEIPHQNGHPRGRSLGGGRSQEMVNGHGQEVWSRRSQDSINGRSQESVNRRSRDYSIQNGMPSSYQTPPTDMPSSALPSRGVVSGSHSSIQRHTTSGHAHSNQIRTQQHQQVHNVHQSSFGVHSSHPSARNRNSGEPEQFDLLAPRETTPIDPTPNNISPVRRGPDPLLSKPNPSGTTPTQLGSSMSSYPLINARSNNNASRPVPVQVAVPRVPPMQAQQHHQQQQQQHHQQQQNYEQQQQQHHQQQQYHEQQQQYHEQQQQQQLEIHSQSNWNSNVPSAHARQPMLRQQPSHAQSSEHTQYYPRGYTTTTTTAAEQIRADTHVSPSHSHSQVSPLQLQENRVTAYQDFNPGPIPVPVGAPVAPLPPLRGNEEHPHNYPSNHHHLTTHPGHPSSANNSFDGTDSLASHSSTSISTTEAYTDKMSKALEQFDSLLTKESSSVIQTTF